MIPSSHVFEGTADNYPFKNELKKEDLEGFGVQVFDGAMVSVLGTSLQNKDLLKFFHDSTWNVIGLEMEGAHYQKAIQAASKIRGNISENVKVRYAYTHQTTHRDRSNTGFWRIRNDWSYANLRNYKKNYRTNF